MAKTIIVNMASIAIATSPDLLQTQALGSCVGVSIYDHQTGIGGMAHPMLPTIGRSRERSKDQRHKFVDTAIEDLVELLLQHGAKKNSLQAKITGGANMFPEIVRKGNLHIGAQNVDASRLKLAEFGIAIVAEDVGGSIGRTVTLDTANGIVKVRSAFSHVREI